MTKIRGDIKEDINEKMLGKPKRAKMESMFEVNTAKI